MPQTPDLNIDEEEDNDEMHDYYYGAMATHASLADTTVDEIAAEDFKAEMPQTPDLNFDEEDDNDEIGQQGEPQAVVLPSYYSGAVVTQSAILSRLDEQMSAVASNDNSARAKRNGKAEKKTKKAKNMGQMQKKESKAHAAASPPAGRGAASGFSLGV
jgi:hypothetical protein